MYNHKMTNFILKLAGLILFIIKSTFVYSQNNIVGVLNKTLIPISSPVNQRNFSFLDTTLEKNTILSIGEETHATREFFLTKNEIIKYCVTNLDYKIISIEADFSGTSAVNEYITQGKGKISEVIYKMGIAAWMTTEMVELIEWLKEFNSQQNKSNQVFFYGFDMQFSSNLVSELKEGILKKENLTEQSREYFNKIINPQLISQEINKAKSSTLIDELKRIPLSNYSLEQTEYYTQLINVFEQYLSFKLAPEGKERLLLRDKSMASNISWLYEIHKKKIIVWAHNEHITKDKSYYKIRTMGSYLSENFGNHYYAIGFFTGEGSLGFYNKIKKGVDYINIPKDTQKKSINCQLGQCIGDNYFLDMSKTTDCGFNNKEYLIRSVTLYFDVRSNEYKSYNSYRKGSIGNNFDGLIYLRKTTGATPFSSEK